MNSSFSYGIHHVPWLLWSLWSRVDVFRGRRLKPWCSGCNTAQLDVSWIRGLSVRGFFMCRMYHCCIIIVHHMYVYNCIYIYVCLSVYLSVCLAINPSIYISIYQSINQSINLSINPWIYHNISYNYGFWCIYCVDSVCGCMHDHV